MSILGIFKNASTELTVAAGITFLVWLAFAGLYPNERLDHAETTLVLACCFAAAKAAGAGLRLWRRRAGGAERP
jgi:hypothetical protein